MCWKTYYDYVCARTPSSLVSFQWSSDVQSKAFKAVDQFLQLVKQHHEKVF